MYGCRFKDISGMRFGRLLVKHVSHRNLSLKDAVYFWLVVCDCGKETRVSGRDLRSGHTTSCGCKKQEILSERLATIRRVTDRLTYSSYNAMKSRCYNANTVSYANCMGRGITVCDRWKESFWNFLEDMGPRPGKEYSLDRINNDENYCPENCRWATRTEQNNNRRPRKIKTVEFSTSQ
jgi:hypothetical protein